MGLPRESIQIGRCYLSEEGRVRRVVSTGTEVSLIVGYQNSRADEFCGGAVINRCCDRV